MKVRILKANKDYWYAKHIGEIFDVYEQTDNDGDYQLILDDNLYINYQDTEIYSGLINKKIDYNRVNELLNSPINKR